MQPAKAKSVPGSLTIGILPDGKVQVSRFVDVAILTDLGQARNNVNVMSSDVIVACGLGGGWNVFRSCAGAEGKEDRDSIGS
jgi:uncharacterized protein (TIGR00725 family)